VALAGVKPALSLRTEAKSRRTVVRLTGVPAERVQRALTVPVASERLFFLAVEPPARGIAVPMLASTAAVSPQVLELTPSTSLTPGTRYVVTFNGPDIDPSLPRLTYRFQVSARSGRSAARVAAIYPTQARLPANLLKFYVRFSAPMGEGKTFAHVRLLDGKERPIAQAFRERELWSENHRRLTLWVNPGRTKKALGLSESLGPVLVPNREYTLEVGAGLTDQQGLPLGKPARKRFRTVAADTKQPRIGGWKLDPPNVGTREPLTVRFSEPMDRALVERVVSVQRAGKSVAGKRVVAEDCSSWRFIPTGLWQAGDYRLIAAGELEDLGGNSLYRAFETYSGTLPTTSPPEFERRFTLK
jgi:hypothetical protein